MISPNQIARQRKEFTKPIKQEPTQSVPKTKNKTLDNLIHIQRETSTVSSVLEKLNNPLTFAVTGIGIVSLALLSLLKHLKGDNLPIVMGGSMGTDTGFVYGDKKTDTLVVKKDIIAESERQGVDPRIALTIAEIESGFGHWESDGSVKKSKGAGAIGLFQLMPATAKGLGVDPYDYYDNIRGGVKYIKQLTSRFGNDIDKIVIAYNSGPSNVGKKYDKLAKETTNYMKKAHQLYDTKYTQASVDSIKKAKVKPRPTSQDSTSGGVSLVNGRGVYTQGSGDAVYKNAGGKVLTSDIIAAKNLVSMQSLGINYNQGIFQNDFPYLEKDFAQRYIKFQQEALNAGYVIIATAGYGGGHAGQGHGVYGTAVDFNVQNRHPFSTATALFEKLARKYNMHLYVESDHYHLEDKRTWGLSDEQKRINMQASMNGYKVASTSDNITKSSVPNINNVESNTSSDTGTKMASASYNSGPVLPPAGVTKERGIVNGFYKNSCDSVC